jgi:hypothetical protein
MSTRPLPETQAFFTARAAMRDAKFPDDGPAFADDSFDAVFAGAIVHHLPAPTYGVVELARVSRPSARLAVFHPIGRAALAARRGATLGADDILAAGAIRLLLRSTGWTRDHDRRQRVALRTPARCCSTSSMPPSLSSTRP